MQENLMADEWAIFRLQVLPADAPESALETLKLCFMSGAIAALSLILGAEDKLPVANGLWDELDAWSEAKIAADQRAAGGAA